MFDDEILFIGSDIWENSSHGIETTVKNRRLVNKNNQVLVNGQNWRQSTGAVQNVYIQSLCVS